MASSWAHAGLIAAALFLFPNDGAAHDFPTSHIDLQWTTDHFLARATVHAIDPSPSGDGRAEVVFDTPQLAVTPGQAVVFYVGDEVAGGGWIE